MFDVRPCADQDEYGRAVGAIGQYFNPPPERGVPRALVRTMPHERMHAAFEDGQIVGGAGAFPFELSVPGGSLPCAGVTAVGVHPTHRRRGVLRAMMDVQLRDVHERGEPIAALWASEETIYGRFGYGLALLGRRAEGAARVGRVRGAARARRHDAVRRSRGGARAVPADLRGGTRERARDDVEERDVVGGPHPARVRGRGERPAPLRRAGGRRRAGRVRDLPDALRLRGRAPGVAARRARGARRDAAGNGGDLALPPRHRLDGRRRGAVRSAGPSALPAPRPAAAGALPDGRRPLGAARRRAAPRCRAARTARVGRSCSRCTTRSASGTTDAGGSTAACASARTPSPISRSTSPRSAPPTSAPSRSRSSVRRSGWRSCATERFERADALFAWRPLPWCLEIF